MVSKLLKYSQKPEKPLQILQGALEIEIQLVVHTVHSYEAQYLRLPPNLGMVRMSDLGYAGRLCNMALVSASAAWDGFLGNLIRAIRANGHSFNERQLRQRLKQTNERIIEPLARRHCIVHNLARVDEDYRKDVPLSPLPIGDALNTDLDYLKDTSVSIFETAVDLVKLLVREGLLGEEYQETIGEFQRDPGLVHNGWAPREVMNMDAKRQFLEAMGVPEEALDSMPSEAWFLSKGFPPDKVRLAFRCVEAPVTYGNWTAVTLSAQDFFKLAAMLPKLAEDMTTK